MRDLLVVVPSRGRPGNAGRLAAAMAETCRARTSLLFGLDDDDPSEYPEGLHYEVRHGLRFVTAWINNLAVPRAGWYGAVGHIGDDNVPLTDGWDVQVLRALGDSPFAFANDLYPREPGSLPSHVFMRSEVVTALGYMAPPQVRHIADLAWREWGNACGITFLPGVIIEHRHWSNGKAPMDPVYQAVNAIDAADNEAFRAYCADGLAADIEKIKSVL